MGTGRSSASAWAIHRPLISCTPRARERCSARALSACVGVMASPSGYQRSARSQSRCFPRRPATATSPRRWSVMSIRPTRRDPYHRWSRGSPFARSSSSRDSSGPRRSNSRRTYRRNERFSAMKSRRHRSCEYRDDVRSRRIRPRMIGRDSIGQMNAFHSNSRRSSQSSRSSSPRSWFPSRLQSTSCCGGATAAIGSS